MWTIMTEVKDPARNGLVMMKRKIIKQADLMSAATFAALSLLWLDVEIEIDQQQPCSRRFDVSMTIDFEPQA